MGLLSLLPPHLSALEWWVTRLFLLLATLTIGPWVLALLYDVVLYLFRSVAYEVPVIGGRARGEMRPRAPSLTERPSGHRRNFSLARRSDVTAQTTGGSKTDAPETRWRHVNDEHETQSTPG